MTFEPLSIAKLEHKSDTFREFNPFQQVPTLVRAKPDTTARASGFARSGRPAPISTTVAALSPTYAPRLPTCPPADLPACRLACAARGARR